MDRDEILAGLRERIVTPARRFPSFLSGSDGFRCPWGLRLDPATRKAAGEAFPVQHFHDRRFTLLPFANPGSIGLSVSGDALAEQVKPR